MRSINVQFHGLLEELVDFLQKVQREHSLTVELERWTPKHQVEVTPESNLAHAVRAFGAVDRFWIIHRPRRGTRVERFMLNVGQLRGCQLAQSQLGAGASTSEAFSVLAQVADELKNRAKAGMWVRTAAGNVGYSKNFRVLPLAAAGSRTGLIQLTDVTFGQTMYPERPERL